MKRRRQREKRSGVRVLGTLMLAAALCALLVPCVSVVAATLENQSRGVSTAAAEPTETVASTDGRMPEKRQLVREAPRQKTQDKEQTAEQPEAPAVQEKTVTPPEAAAPVEDTYFSDTVFVGDSRTEGFHLYSGLKEGQYLYSVGATVSSIFTKATEQTAAGKVPIMDALTGMECSKVCVMLGVNELGWVSSQTFRDQYEKVIDRIQTDHPDATVMIQSILPVSQAQDDKKTYVNNARIREYNALLEDLAQEKGCVYLDVASAVSDEAGCLRADLTFEGIHLNPAGCRAWLQYLKEHPVDG